MVLSSLATEAREDSAELKHGDNSPPSQPSIPPAGLLLIILTVGMIILVGVAIIQEVQLGTKDCTPAHPCDAIAEMWTSLDALSIVAGWVFNAPLLVKIIGIVVVLIGLIKYHGQLSLLFAEIAHPGDYL